MDLEVGEEEEEGASRLAFWVEISHFTTPICLYMKFMLLCYVLYVFIIGKGISPPI